MEIKMLINKEEVYTGHPADVKEKIQDLFEEKYGFFIDIEENSEEDILEEDIYQVYLHTETYEELTNEELLVLEELNLSEEGDEMMIALAESMGMSFEIIQSS